LRVLHDGSFSDDPTRMLRLARYAARLGFDCEPHTRALLDQAVAGGALDTVSGARIGAELRLLSRESDPVAALRALHVLGLDRALGLDGGEDAAALAARALSLLPSDGRRDRLLLAVAGLDQDGLGARLDAWGFAAVDRDVITAAAGDAGALSTRLRAANRPSEVAAAVGGAPAEAIALAGALGAETQARQWFERLRDVRLEIDGDDLLAAGVPAGPAVGRGLRAALADKLDGRVSSRAEELASALRGAGVSVSG
jgi:tRNA nucleotidyltransferase (CCA-adding enzyme)